MCFQEHLLTILNLARNHFSGQIPKNIGSICTLQVADFSGNQLSSFEKGIKSSEVLLLAGNKQLTINFSTLLGAMESTGSLRILNTSQCSFLGIIPVKLWGLNNLITIYLKNNRLTGRFPWSPDPPLFLHDLDVSVEQPFWGNLSIFLQLYFLWNY